ncbi:DNA helicase-like protein [Lineolata rhizophorae]|uniref:DNA helicase n=1 Tax=Lineolata rhizophorae TaxID=578093 RepID=A0A6A6NMV8_9PEZI|nr:DNA helicase-like protein [Lineolata rhizophorae]
MTTKLPHRPRGNASRPPAAATIDVPSFAAAQLSLLATEHAAEASEMALLASAHSPAQLARAGLAVRNLLVASQRTGMGGKTVVELEGDPATSGGGEKGDAGGSGGVIGEHGIRVGDVVGLQSQEGSGESGKKRGGAGKKEKQSNADKGVEGVVVRVKQDAISLALGKGDDRDDADLPQGRVWLVKLANEVTYKRMKQTMERLEKLRDSDYTPLMRTLFGLTPLSDIPPGAEEGTSGDTVKDSEWISERLNDGQKRAVRFALAAPEVALIHGPPGTGKTHTLIELILQLVICRGKRLLVCGPSNISVDNIAERLAPYIKEVPLVRLGHPARLLPSVLSHSLDVLTRTSDAAQIVQDVRREMDAKQASIRKTRNGRERRAIYADLKELRKEYRQREQGCVSSLVKGSKVVLATLHGAGGHHLKNEQFDVVIIDEASQALEAQCWVPLLTAKKVVLAGDHLQLPPTIKSLNSKATKEAKDKKGKGAKAQVEPDPKAADAAQPTTLETTLFDRLLGLHGPSIKRMLTTQYRMHSLINEFPSAELYDGQLVADDSVKERLLRDLPYEVQDTDDTREPLVFHDTQGGDFPERPEDDVPLSGGLGSLNESRSNELEAALVKQHVESLVGAGVRPEDVAVVTPYSAQLGVVSRLLREAFPGIELGSVDGFQGREKEAVVLSLVRSNPEHEVGFLGEKRRLNVAMTRPKRHLCVIGDSETVGRGSKFLKRWMAYLEEKADLRYPDASSLSVLG